MMRYCRKTEDKMERFIPVVVIKELSETDKILTALKNSGILCAEITFRTACAAEAIAYAAKHYPDMEIGVPNGHQSRHKCFQQDGGKPDLRRSDPESRWRRMRYTQQSSWSGTWAARPWPPRIPGKRAYFLLSTLRWSSEKCSSVRGSRRDY